MSSAFSLCNFDRLIFICCSWCKRIYSMNNCVKNSTVNYEQNEGGKEENKSYKLIGRHARDVSNVHQQSRQAGRQSASNWMTASVAVGRSVRSVYSSDSINGTSEHQRQLKSCRLITKPRSGEADGNGNVMENYVIVLQIFTNKMQLTENIKYVFPFNCLIVSLYSIIISIIINNLTILD